MIESKEISFYNLAFGDWNDETSMLDDMAATNNADTEKVLASIAAIVIDFTDHIPSAIIYAEGSTASSTRRYQMGIAKLWEEIKTGFEIYGIKPDETIEAFQINVNYDAFWLRKK